jgi:hypothetical protein
MAKRKLTVDVFPDDVEVTIKVDGDLYTRISEMMFETVIVTDTKQLGEHLDKILNSEPTNRYEYHMGTLLTLISMIENEVRNNNLSVKKEIEIGDDDDDVTPSPETPAES